MDYKEVVKHSKEDQNKSQSLNHQFSQSELRTNSQGTNILHAAHCGQNTKIFFNFLNYIFKYIFLCSKN